MFTRPPACSAADCGPMRLLISEAIVRNACSTLVADLAEVSRNGMPSWSAYSCIGGGGHVSQSLGRRTLGHNAHTDRDVVGVCASRRYFRVGYYAPANLWPLAAEFEFNFKEHMDLSNTARNFEDHIRSNSFRVIKKYT